MWQNCDKIIRGSPVLLRNSTRVKTWPVTSFVTRVTWHRWVWGNYTDRQLIRSRSFSIISIFQANVRKSGCILLIIGLLRLKVTNYFGQGWPYCGVWTLIFYIFYWSVAPMILRFRIKNTIDHKLKSYSGSVNWFLFTTKVDTMCLFVSPSNGTSI